VEILEGTLGADSYLRNVLDKIPMYCMY